MSYYTIGTPQQIVIDFTTAINCPVCGLDRGLVLSTSGDGQPVTGSCPAEHVWDEQRVTGTEVKIKAIELEREGR